MKIPPNNPFNGVIMMGKIAKFMLENDKVAVWLNVELIEVKEGYAKIAMIVREDMLNAAGICQGGAIFSFADFAFALASNSYGKIALAVSANINFANPAFKDEKLIAEAKELNKTRRTGLYQIEVRKEENNQLVSLFTGQVFIKDKEILP
jgi:acyl-CoA thioesterase